MEVSVQLHTRAALHPWKEPFGTHWTGGWMDPRAGLDAMDKRKMMPLPEIEPQGRRN
jgi:hypothetical protein